MADDLSVPDQQNEEAAAQEEEAQQEQQASSKQRRQKKGTSTEMKVLQYVGGGVAGIFGSTFLLLIAITLAVAVGFSLIHPDTAGGGVGACTTPVACAVPGDIVQTAEKLAWPDSGHSAAKGVYLNALNKYGTQGDPTDCGRFVATVLRASNADPNYPPVGVVNQWPYVQSHPKLYQIVSTNLTNTSQLKPGDILYSQVITAGIGHTAIYIGRQAGEATNTLSASLGGHVPEANSDWYGAGPGAGEAGGMIKAARYIGG